MKIGPVERGPAVQAVQHHGAPMPTPAPGEHLWIMGGFWRVDPVKIAEGEAVHLDTENLLTLDGPGCYVCEQAWTPEIGARPCPGEPRRGG